MTSVKWVWNEWVNTSILNPNRQLTLNIFRTFVLVFLLFEHVIAGWDFLFSLEFTCTNGTKYLRMDQVKGCLQIFGGSILEYLS